jgi:competence ComEA-like helix-hairpin-helix protein
VAFTLLAVRFASGWATAPRPTVTTVASGTPAAEAEDARELERWKEALRGDGENFFPNAPSGGSASLPKMPVPLGEVSPGGSVPKALPGTVLDLNAASLEELQTLPGVGPVLAARIADERERRPFARVEDLRHVSGIGVKTLERLRPYVRVGPAGPVASRPS